ncbi:MAG: xylulokinase [Terracidiphilus sp.]
MTALRDRLLLAVDLGTSGCKCALVGSDARVRRWAFRPAALHVVDRTGVEQEPEEWWRAFLEAAREVLAPVREQGGEIAAICCSCQGECTVAVDGDGRPLHRALSWMDMRGAGAIRRIAGRGPLAISGYNALKLWRWIRLSGGAPSLSGKDPAGHIAFIREAWPDLYERTFKFLNALDYMNLRLTGRFAATADSILTTWVTDNRDPNHIRYDASLMRQTGIDAGKLPEIVRSTDVLGTLVPAVAAELGLPENTPVVAGAVDNSAAAIGAGAIADGDTHLYIGTSSWLGAHVPFMRTDVFSQVASVPCAVPDRYLAVALQSAAGANLSHLLDRVLYPRENGGERPEAVYEAVEKLVASTPAGARGLLYTPWLCGERTPANDANLRASLLNLSLEHGRGEILRAVFEGVALNTRWMFEPFARFLGKPPRSITMVGGGAASDSWCQIFADVLGVPIRQVQSPIQANAIGAALIGFVGIGALGWEEIASRIEIRRTYQPDAANRALYGEMYLGFKQAGRKLSALHRRWNRPGRAQR